MLSLSPVAWLNCAKMATGENSMLSTKYPGWRSIGEGGRQTRSRRSSWPGARRLDGHWRPSFSQQMFARHLNNKITTDLNLCHKGSRSWWSAPKRYAHMSQTHITATKNWRTWLPAKVAHFKQNPNVITNKLFQTDNLSYGICLHGVASPVSFMSSQPQTQRRAFKVVRWNRIDQGKGETSWAVMGITFALQCCGAVAFYTLKHALHTSNFTQQLEVSARVVCRWWGELIFFMRWEVRRMRSRTFKKRGVFYSSRITFINFQEWHFSQLFHLGLHQNIRPKCFS